MSQLPASLLLVWFTGIQASKILTHTHKINTSMIFDKKLNKKNVYGYAYIK